MVSIPQNKLETFVDMVSVTFTSFIYGKIIPDRDWDAN